MMNDNFAVFILTHGRPENQITLKSLKNGNYTGKVYFIIDNEDETAEKYYENFGKENVIMFNKSEAFKTFDIGDTFNDRRCVVAARNITHKIAKSLNLEYFLVLDDDYTSFLYRYISEDKKQLLSKNLTNLDEIFKIFVDFLESSGAYTVTFAQGGDFIGGVGSSYSKKVMRKAMNTFFCKTDRPFQFYGRINEDTTAYVVDGQRGKLFLTITDIMVNQVQTQANKGGLTEIYLNLGTYVKSFYSVMFAPSCVKVAMMGDTDRRLHHRINWNACAPKILNEKWKK